MPPVPPLMTSTVAIDSNGNGWIYEPSGIAHDIGLMPLGSTNPGTTPPANPQLGWLWWDSGVNELKAWNGTAWQASSGGGSGGIGEPTTAGSFLRTNTGTWVAGVPLTGGTLTGPGNLTANGWLSVWGQLRFGQFNQFTAVVEPEPIGPSWSWVLRNTAGQPALRYDTTEDVLSLGASPHFVAKSSNGVTVGTPTGPAVPLLVGNVNVQGGYYVNGVSIGTPPFASLTISSTIPATPVDGQLWMYPDNTPFTAGPLTGSMVGPTLVFYSSSLGTWLPITFGASHNGKPISQGDPDSGGLGFRVLRVPN